MQETFFKAFLVWATVSSNKTQVASNSSNESLGGFVSMQRGASLQLSLQLAYDFAFHAWLQT
jgi:hypothetical protein